MFKSQIDYSDKIKEFHNELNKSVAEFNIDSKNSENFSNSEKFGILSNVTKKGIFNNITQNFKCVQINPFLQPVELDLDVFKNIIDLNEIKNKKNYDHGLKKDVNLDIDFGNFEILNFDVDNQNKSKFILSEPSGIFGLFHNAYACHKNIFIRPDDLWFHIVLQIQILIDKNSDKLRECFVHHDEKKEIIVDTKLYSKKSFMDFVVGSNKQMKKDVKNDFIEIVNTKFSTTSNFDVELSNILSMCSMKHYYSFKMSELCGIRNIFFGGELEDWIKIKINLEKINNFDSTKILSNYINKVIPIVDKFIEAIQFKPDVDFFNKVMRQDATIVGEFSLGYGDGSEITKYVDGWIKDLYSNLSDSNHILPDKFEEYVCKCDFQLDKFDGTIEHKTINTSSGIGFKYHDEFDGFSLIKAWWICNKNNSDVNDKSNYEINF